MFPLRQRGRRLASELSDGKFKMLIDTTLGGSDTDKFILPLSGGSWRGMVSWGDGSSQPLDGTPGNVTHTYVSPGQYVVSLWNRIDGSQFRVTFNNGGDKLKLLKILQWGTNYWTGFNLSFFGCSNLVVAATDAAMARTHGITDMTAAFRGCTSLKAFEPFDTRAVTTMDGVFLGCTALQSFPFRQTRACTNFYNFCYGSGLTSFQWIDTSAGQNFTGAWYNCTGLNTYDFPELDMHNITDGTNMMTNVAISKASYNNMLDQLAYGRGSIAAAAATSISFKTGAQYDSSTGGYNGTAARAYLTGTQSWSIVDGGTP